MTGLAAGAAYEAAGIGPDDTDGVEVHEAAASAELMAYEQLGLTLSDNVTSAIHVFGRE